MISLQVDYFGAEHLHASGAETPSPGASAGAIVGRFDRPTPKPHILLDMTHLSGAHNIHHYALPMELPAACTADSSL
jgi:hypothetical protein